MALLDELSEAALVLGRQQVDLTDLTQVQPHGVARAAVDPNRPLLTTATATAREQTLDVLVVEHDLA